MESGHLGALITVILPRSIECVLLVIAEARDLSRPSNEHAKTDLRIVASHQPRVTAAPPKAITAAIAILRSRPFTAVPVAASA